MCVQLQHKTIHKVKGVNSKNAIYEIFYFKATKLIYKVNFLTF